MSEDVFRLMQTFADIRRRFPTCGDIQMRVLDTTMHFVVEFNSHFGLFEHLVQCRNFI